MPYQPGVQDISGQLRAQGRAGMITGIGEGIAGGFQEYSRNKFLTGQSTAKWEAAVRANPEIAQVLESPNAPSDAAKAFAKLHKDGAVGLRDAAVLAQFADSFVSQKKESQQQQAAQLQLEAARRQGTVDQRLLSTPVGDNPFLQIGASAAQAGMTPGNVAQLLTAGARINGVSKPDKTEPELRRMGGQQVIFSPGTGAISVLPQTAEQLGSIEAAKTEAETTAKSASSLLNEITDRAEDARHTIGTVDRVLGLYDEGVQSGFGQSTLTQAKSALARFGLGGEGVANQQQFEKELNNLVLERGRELMKGSGAVSNYEREAISRATANPSLTPEANKQILGVMKRAAERTVKLDELRSKLEDEGKSNVEISKAIRKARDAMPIGVDELVVTSAPQPVAAAKPAAPAAPVRILSIRKLD